MAAIERTREYRGLYHVLHGVLSPLSHIGPDDLTIKALVERVGKTEVREIIMATNPDTEGEATAVYLSRLLRPFGVRITRLTAFPSAHIWSLPTRSRCPTRSTADRKCPSEITRL